GREVGGGARCEVEQRVPRRWFGASLQRRTQPSSSHGGAHPAPCGAARRGAAHDDDPVNRTVPR
ncbi:hypothetical protein, partial [Curtobacterium poinsettiae]|uniref:hypothetical protein n=1 Tax=Curtobacterium poinsettiae TaxID=159612 RepID=UPI0023601B14